MELYESARFPIRQAQKSAPDAMNIHEAIQELHGSLVSERTNLGGTFGRAKKGRWVGTRSSLFCIAPEPAGPFRDPKNSPIQCLTRSSCRQRHVILF